MTIRYSSTGHSLRSVHHVPATTLRPMAKILRCVGAAAVLAGISGATWFIINVTLDEMTWRDCRAGIVAACEALQR